MPSNRVRIRKAVARAVDRKSRRLRIGLLSAVRAAAPVDTGELRGSIRAGRGDVLLEVSAPHWFYTNRGYPPAGNARNRGWLENAINRVVRANGGRVRTNI